MLGIGVHRLQVIQRRGGIGQLADALVILALAAAHPAEVEAQHREAKLVERIMQVIHDAVVHGAAELRMRMQHDGNRGVSVFLGVVSAFQTALGAGENHFGHRLA